MDISTTNLGPHYLSFDIFFPTAALNLFISNIQKKLLLNLSSSFPHSFSSFDYFHWIPFHPTKKIKNTIVRPCRTQLHLLLSVLAPAFLSEPPRPVTAYGSSQCNDLATASCSSGLGELWDPKTWSDRNEVHHLPSLPSTPSLAVLALPSHTVPMVKTHPLTPMHN